MGGTSASPSMERNLQSLKTIAIVYSNFLLGKRPKLRGRITGRSQIILQQSTKHRTKLSWTGHIRWVERDQMSRKERIQLSSQVPEVRVLDNFSRKLWILNSMKCLLNTTLNYCRHYSFTRKIFFISLDCFFVLSSRSKLKSHSCWGIVPRGHRLWRIPAQWNTAHWSYTISQKTDCLLNDG